MAAKDYTKVGMIYSRLTVVGDPFKDKFHIYKVRCRCECGNETEPSCRQLVVGQTKSCGCLKVDSGRARKIDPLPGDRFGMLTVVKCIDPEAGHKRLFLCMCDCGNESAIKITLFRSANTKSCGCLVAMTQRDNHPIPIGEKYGRLTVLAEAEKTGANRQVKAVCDCGIQVTTAINNLRSGHTTSCGCIKGDAQVRHGMSGTPTYQVWRDMINRCDNQNYKEFKYYGGRGITFCRQWRVFDNFFLDMGIKPEGLTLDRIDYDGNYDISNCRWASDIQQANNKRNNIRVFGLGKEQTVAEWARELGVPDKRIYARIASGWSPYRAVFGK
jgi:hypothetical protein